MKLKVAVVLRDRKFGIGNHTFNLAEELRKLGVSVDLYEGQTYFNTNIIPRRLRLNYDIVHIQGSGAGAFPSRSKRVTTVHTLVRTEYKYEPSILNLVGQFFEKATIKNADTIISVNPCLSYLLQTEYKVSKDRIKDIPNGINTRPFDTLGNIERSNFILAGGRDTPRKRFDILAKAIVAIRSSPVLKTFGKDSYLPRKAINRLYKTAIMFVCTSEYETGPLTVMEAMAAKCPVICSDIPEVKNLVIDGKTGLLFPTNNIESLVEKIETLLNDAELRCTLADNAYDHIVKQFNWGAVALKTLGVYEALL